MLLGYYDPDKKKTVADKLDDAIDRYECKHGERPNLALMSFEQYPEIEMPPLGVEVRPYQYAAPNTFYIGQYDDGVAS